MQRSGKSCVMLINALFTLTETRTLRFDSDILISQYVQVICINSISTNKNQGRTTFYPIGYTNINTCSLMMFSHDFAGNDLTWQNGIENHCIGRYLAKANLRKSLLLAVLVKMVHGFTTLILYVGYVASVENIKL